MLGVVGGASDAHVDQCRVGEDVGDSQRQTLCLSSAHKCHGSERITAKTEETVTVSDRARCELHDLLPKTAEQRLQSSLLGVGYGCRHVAGVRLHNSFAQGGCHGLQRTAVELGRSGARKMAHGEVEGWDHVERKVAWQSLTKALDQG